MYRVEPVIFKVVKRPLLGVPATVRADVRAQVYRQIYDLVLIRVRDEVWFHINSRTPPLE